MKWIKAAALSLAFLAQPAAAQTSDLEGLWVVEREYAPTLRGELVVSRQGDAWRAEIAGAGVEIAGADETLRFDFGDHGAFRGRLVSGAIQGVWLQPNSDAENRDDPTATSQAFATPLTLNRRAADMVEIIERSAEVMLGCYAVGKEPPVLPKDAVEYFRKLGDIVA
jgi:hypothetical protein